MPFQKFGPFLTQEELKALTAAFDATWQELTTSGMDVSSEDKVALLKRKLTPADPRVSHGRWRPRRGDAEKTGYGEPHICTEGSLKGDPNRHAFRL